LVKDDIAKEAETGKIYRPNYCGKDGRPVIVMRTNRQVSSENHF